MIFSSIKVSVINKQKKTVIFNPQSKLLLFCYDGRQNNKTVQAKGDSPFSHVLRSFWQ